MGDGRWVMGDEWAMGDGFDEEAAACHMTCAVLSEAPSILSLPMRLACVLADTRRVRTRRAGGCCGGGVRGGVASPMHMNVTPSKGVVRIAREFLTKPNLDCGVLSGAFIT